MTSSTPVTLIALAGLPGTGKSTLARALAAELGAPVLDKDRVREALFGAEHVDYSRAQDDLCMAAIYAAAAHLCARFVAPRGGSAGTAAAGSARHAASAGPARVAAILDGRTFTRRDSVHALLDAARAADAALLLVECRCAPEAAEARLLRDAERGDHPAANRGPALHRRLAAGADDLAATLAARLAEDSGAPPMRAGAAPMHAGASPAPGASPGRGAPAHVRHLVIETDRDALPVQVSRVGAALRG